MATDSLRRRFRVQLSLRTLLVLMALVGVGLAIFRWPWVETTAYDRMVNSIGPDQRYRPNLVYHYERRTTLRRNWRAEPVKSGLEQIWREGVLWHEAHFYEGELHGPRRVRDRQGRLIIEARYRGGKLHGPFRAGDGTTWIGEGNYRDDQMHGAWRVRKPRSFAFVNIPPASILNNFDIDALPGNTEWETIPPFSNGIVVESNWNRGERQGRTVWKTADGEALNVAEYDRNQLVRWNGEPVVEQFRQWLLSKEVNDPQLASQLFTEYESVWLRRLEGGRFLGSGWRLPASLGEDVWLKLFPKNGSPLEFVIHRTAPIPDSLALVEDTSAPGPDLCEMAAVNGLGFRYRYGGLWLVPRADPEPPFIDPTGTSNIEFAPGSVQAREWDEVVDVPASAENTAGCVAALLEGTSLPYVTDAVDQPLDQSAAKLSNPTLTPIAIFRRSRRNAVGFVLYRTGCCCEIQGGKLVIRPRKNQTEAERKWPPDTLARAFAKPRHA